MTGFMMSKMFLLSNYILQRARNFFLTLRFSNGEMDGGQRIEN